MTAQADIQIVDIEVELKRLWESVPDKSQIKACLCTLVIYSRDKKQATELQQLVQVVVEKFPCRIIFIQEDPKSNQSYLHVKVSNELLGRQNAKFTCDQISIDTSSSELSRVPFLVMPHLVPDLPIYLLWGPDPTQENTILPHLEKFATRLVFDGTCVDNLQAFSKRMLADIDQQKNIDFLDLVWMQISGWREVLSKVFNSPEKMNLLMDNKGIHIRYNKRNETGKEELHAFYLSNWLAAQLQWKFVAQEKQEEAIVYTYSNEKGSFPIILSPENNSKFPSGAILEVNISSKDDHFISFTPMTQAPKIVIHISCLETCELPFSLPLPDFRRSSSLMKAILYSRTSCHYRNMLQAIAKIKINFSNN